MRPLFRFALYVIFAVGLLLPGRMQAQSEQVAGFAAAAATEPGAAAGFASNTDAAADTDAAVLPDEPGVMLAGTDAPVRSNAVALQPVAPKYAHKILPGQQAQPLTAGDKFAYATRDRVTVGAFADVLWRAGFEQAINGKPHYGTDSGAFGERLAASAFKQTASHVLTNGVFASVLHDDPRYYQMGRSHTFKERVVYAGTRVIFTRKDDGRQAVNYPRLMATATIAGLNNLYYPQQDRGWASSFESGITSLGIKAAGYELSEFMGDMLHAVHLRKTAE